ncbi:MAG: hypothetical protein ACK4F9_07510 [Brevinematia bacterium]
MRYRYKKRDFLKDVLFSPEFIGVIFVVIIFAVALALVFLPKEILHKISVLPFFSIF